MGVYVYTRIRYYVFVYVYLVHGSTIHIAPHWHLTRIHAHRRHHTLLRRHSLHWHAWIIHHSGSHSNRGRRQFWHRSLFYMLYGFIELAVVFLAAQAADEIVGAVDDDIRKEATDDAIGNRVREGHERDGDKCGNGLAVVAPFDIYQPTHHHRAHCDERRASCPGWHRRQQRRKKDGQQKVERHHNGGQTRPASLFNSGR
mmetsp:Transcript_79724/g.129239  ORF Transcript_79724/g.129239 Transcript_79724/m.129239 type:complete len:200 (-) Transcript_79724:1217-1816(-)